MAAAGPRRVHIAVQGASECVPVTLHGDELEDAALEEVLSILYEHLPRHLDSSKPSQPEIVAGRTVQMCFKVVKNDADYRVLVPQEERSGAYNALRPLKMRAVCRVERLDSDQPEMRSTFTGAVQHHAHGPLPGRTQQLVLAPRGTLAPPGAPAAADAAPSTTDQL